jgi:endo-1,4-beta-xylanase
MRQPSSLRVVAIAVAVAVAGLVPAVAASTDTAAAAEPTVILSTDFEDGSYAPWVLSGGPSLSVVDVPEGKALLVDNRTADYDGIASPAGTLTPGQEYGFSMKVRLADGTPGSADVRFVGVPGYTWIGNTSMTADAWTTVTGSWTVPEDADATANVYIGTADTGAPYSYLVDDLVITGIPAAPAVVTVAALDFDTESIDPWTASGSPTLAYVDADGGKALSITRAADYEGIQSPVGIFEAGVVYTLSMRARLPEGTAGSTDVRFVVKPAYTWVGNATITGDGWTEITGTYTVPADVVAAETQVYIGSTDQAGPYPILVDDLLITRPASTGPGTEVDLAFDFEDGLQGWLPRADADGAPTVATTTTEAHGGVQAALVSDRTTQGDGIGYDLAGVLEEGITYDVTAWVKMAAGEAVDDLWLSIQTGESSFSTVAQFADVPSGEWQQVTASYTFPGGDMAFLYFETSFSSGGPGSFLVDDVTIQSQEPPVVQPLTPIKDTVDFPVGVAIDERETLGSASELLLRHFDQITPENHMKVEAWYDADQVFTPHPQGDALMTYAQANDLRLYAHTLLWHSQTPAWFFQNAAGEPLTDSAEDQQVLRDRLRTHIFDVAGHLSGEWGLFGSATNPLVGVDVVNEVISDQATADGLRTSEWYRILGSEYITLAFELADEAFNDVYADPAADRPVTLFINDYNTEVPDKAARLHSLVSDLLAAGVPVDGVGHQFHASLSRPVETFDAALTLFEDLPVVQAVTELDVTVGTPVTQANLIEQGYYYRDAFEIFRAHASSLFSVTLWGLTDNRSWRSTQAPLAFDGGLQAKPAYYGIVGGELEPRLRTAIVFSGDVPIGPDAAAALDWLLLPLHEVEDVAGFQLRWAPDHLTAYVEVTDATDDPTDAVAVAVGGSTVTVGRHDAASDAAVVTPTDAGYVVVLRVPLEPVAAEGDTLDANVLVTDAATTTGWSAAETTGTLTLVEPLSYVGVVAADAAPTIDGAIDAAWADADAVTTDTVVQGATDGATAKVRTLWADDTLYVLAEVTDPQLDATGSDPWVKDSVEIFVDAGNAKNGPYRSEDVQIRVNYLNEVTLDHGDEAASRLQTATAVVDGGYVVEAAIDLVGTGGAGTFHGLDVQVNDATPGAGGTPGTRTSVRSWADPTGVGYQSTSRWGVAQLLEPPFVPDPDVTLDTHLVRAGGTVGVELSGYLPGSTVTIQLERWAFPWFWHARPVVLDSVTVDDQGSATVEVTVPQRTTLGVYTLAAVAGDLRAGEPLIVLPGHWWFPGRGRR